MVEEQVGIVWNHIKFTPLLEKLHSNGMNQDKTIVIIRGYSIPISDEGIELEWWSEKRNLSEEELKRPIPIYLRDYVDLKTIHSSTAASLEHIFPDHSYENMVFQQVYDWLKKRRYDIQQTIVEYNDNLKEEMMNRALEKAGLQPLEEEEGVNEGGDIIEGQALLGEEEEEVTEEEVAEETPEPNQTSLELASEGLPLLLWNTILGRDVEKDEYYVQLEDCINKKMMTEHNDEEHIQIIRELADISDLGDPKNRSHLLYVQAKIIRFLSLDANEIKECLDIIYIVPDDLCEQGLSGDPMRIIGSFLNIDTKITNDKTKMKNYYTVMNTLAKYAPDIVKQVVEISRSYEKNRCNGEIHPNTVLLQNIHENMFVNQNKLAMSLPDLGLSEFFFDFKQNILTKVILLAFVAYLISKIISLFQIQYNIRS
jgi:hypothetical protein